MSEIGWLITYLSLFGLILMLGFSLSQLEDRIEKLEKATRGDKP